jgi:acetylornithine deacetylase/succinyl-diaminopimelate desuccinylase-like protein
MYQMLRDKTSGLRQTVIDMARRFIATPSPSLKEGPLAEQVLKAMSDVGFDPVIRDDFGNIVGVMGGREAHPTLLLNCHLDTVIRDDFDAAKTGTIQGNRLFGPGAADCKGGLAAQICAAALLKRSLLPLRGNIVLAATVAEENGFSIGVRRLLERTLPQMNLKPDYAILGEPTGLGLYYGHDGWLEMDVRVEGSNPVHVDDAARTIADQLRSYDDAREVSVSYAPPATERAVLCSSTLRVERRLHATEDADDIARQIRRTTGLATQNSGMVVVKTALREETQKLYTGRTLVVKYITHAWATDPFNPLLDRARQVLAAAGKPVQPAKWKLGQLGMGTAGSVLVNEFKVPTVGYGPGDESEAHTATESIDLDRLADAVYGTAVLAHGLVGIPVYGWAADEI